MILFLDFDGVTHPWPAGSNGLFTKGCLDSISKAISDFDVDIVITSTWREKKTLPEMKENLGGLGEKSIGVTPVIDDPFMHHVRFYEIQLYLEQNKRINSQWIALDDTPAFFPKGLKNLLLIDSRTGFSHADIGRLKAKINHL